MLGAETTSPFSWSDTRSWINKAMSMATTPPVAPAPPPQDTSGGIVNVTEKTPDGKVALSTGSKPSFWGKYKWWIIGAGVAAGGGAAVLAWRKGR